MKEKEEEEDGREVPQEERHGAKEE